jgi:large subunit ribosomal protein L4
MKTVPIYKHDGSESGKVELPKDVFGIEPSMNALYQVIKAHLANRRQGTAKAKSRSEVNMAKSKPWRQKGTGRARAGSANSPIWKGGGVIFGPQPRDYTQKVNKNIRRLGLKSAYSIKASEDNVIIVEDFELKEPKTKNVASVLKVLGLAGKKVMFLLPGQDDVLYKSVRNIPNIKTEAAENVNTYDVANSEVLLMTPTSVEQVKELFQR